MTKVLAINGSARMEKGYTHTMLNAFLEGVRDAEATVELVYAKKLKIRPCLGDFQCWYDKVGECIQKDDMELLYPKLRKTDILVLAIPVYLPLPGEIQNLLNRLMPIVEPLLEFKDGRTRAKFHDDVRIFKIVLLAVGGWWEIEFGGPILRPHASLMKENKEKSEEILDATKKAGKQLIEEGDIAADILEIISQPLISEEALRKRYNHSYEQARRSST
jgi:multimeric flavodoxin WrbA